jgi:hypothetical protein
MNRPKTIVVTRKRARWVSANAREVIQLPLK